VPRWKADDIDLKKKEKGRRRETTCQERKATSLNRTGVQMKKKATLTGRDGLAGLRKKP